MLGAARVIAGGLADPRPPGRSTAGEVPRPANCRQLGEAPFLWAQRLTSAHNVLTSRPTCPLTPLSLLVPTAKSSVSHRPFSSASSAHCPALCSELHPGLHLGSRWQKSAGTRGCPEKLAAEGRRQREHSLDEGGRLHSPCTVTWDLETPTQSAASQRPGLRRSPTLPCPRIPLPVGRSQECPLPFPDVAGPCRVFGS